MHNRNVSLESTDTPFSSSLDIIHNRTFDEESYDSDIIPDTPELKSRKKFITGSSPTEGDNKLPNIDIESILRENVALKEVNKLLVTQNSILKKKLKQIPAKKAT